MKSKYARPWMVIASVWIAAAVVGSIAGCPGTPTTTDTAPTPGVAGSKPLPGKKTDKSQVVVETYKVDEGLPAVALDDGFKPRKFSEEEEKQLQPGMALRFVSAPGPKGTTVDARGVRLASLHVPAETPHSSMLKAGAFNAVLSGLLKRDLDGDYRFKLIGTGNAVLFINNKEATTLKDGVGKESASVTLSQGYNKIDVAYVSPANGNATLRVYWKCDETGQEFAWEPLPPDLLKTRADDLALASGQSLREGRLLFATLGCAQCHGLPAGAPLDKCQMPELQQRGPSLENAGHRFNFDWLVEWITDPAAMQSEATMPHLLQGADAPKQASDIAAYVASLKVGNPFAASKEEEELSTEGKKHFVNLGCIACHRLPEDEDPDEPDEFNRVSLYYVGAKYAPGALEDYLRRPHERNPWSRMPDFRLSPEEARELTSYLLENADGVDLKPFGNAKNGEKLFKEVGCTQCHSTAENAPQAKPMVGFPKPVAKGCLADDDAERGKAPKYGLTAAQRSGLRSFLGTDGSSLTRESSAEFSLRQVNLLQCSACHNRDGTFSRWYTVINKETGKDPEYLPHLTWTGEKLQPEWTQKLLAGLHTHSARPWLKARMPAFPTRAEMVAQGLSHENGFALKEDPRPDRNAELAKIAEETLIPQAGGSGFYCNQCHAIGNTKAVEPFGSDGINLLDAALRLRFDYYMRWMIDPKRVDNTAKMTKYTIEGGKKSKIADELDGDPYRQFEAIWHYMQMLPAMQDDKGKRH